MLLLLFVLFLLLRLACLTADPPAGFSLDFFGDEGCWVHNVRNKVLFGSWILDDINMAYLISPTYCFSLYAFLKIFGSGLYQARLVSAVPGALAPILFYLIIRRLWHHRAALWGALLLGTNFFFLCFNRIALVDSLLLTTLLAAFWLWFAGEARPLCMLPAGAVFALACLVKISALFVAPVFLCLLLAGRREKNKAGVPGVLLFALGFLMIAAAFAAAIAWPNLAYLNILKGKFVKHNFPLNPLQMIANFFIYVVSLQPSGVSYKHFVLWLPVTLFAAWLYLVHAARLFLEKGKAFWGDLSRLEIFALSWFFSYFIILGPMAYKPDRRFVLFLPPLIIMALKALMDGLGFSISRVTRDIFDRREGALPGRLLLLCVTLSLPLIYLGPLFAKWMYPWLVRMDRAMGLGAITGTVGFMAVSACFLICFAGLVFLLYLSRRVLSRLETPLNPPFYPAALLILLFNLGLYGFFLYHATFTVYDASRGLDRRFSGQTVVMGEPSDTLCLETKAFSFFTAGRTPGKILNDNAVERFSPDYYLMMKYENNPLQNRPVGISEDQLDFIEDIPLLPDLEGRPRMHAGLFRVIK
jgi:hypothetical protein